MIAKALFIFMLFVLPVAILAQDTEIKVPDDVKPFVGKGLAAIAVESADLNGDGKGDYILVVDDPKAEGGGDGDLRTLMILTREADGKLILAKQNNQVAYCRSCGGVMGDPFAGVEVRPNSFTVNNYGGSSWRWSATYTFNYSRKDRTWQLVKAVDESFNTFEPKKVKRVVHTPRSFGKVDIADFDSDKIH